MEIITKNIIHSTKHIGSFLLLIFIATFRPTAIWADFPISLEPIAVLMIGVLLVFKVYSTIGFNEFIKKYKIQLLLLCAYFFVCFLSLFFNSYRYADSNELIRYGITFIVITMSFPAAIFLFILPQNENMPSLSRFKYSAYLPWLYFTLLALMAIWQYLDFNSAKIISQFFISSEVWPINNINGFFRISTDLAAVLAMLTILSSLFLITGHKSSINSFVILLLLVLFITGGILTGSRIFFLILLVALIIVAYVKMKNNVGFVFSIIFLLFSLLHISIYIFPDIIIYKLGLLFPYIRALQIGELITLQDMVPRISSSFLAGRADIWHSALSEIKNNWLYGISGGGFRLLNVPVPNNTHNVILQILIDTGLIGLTIVTSLFFYVIHGVRRLMKVFVLVLPLSFSLLIDFQIDHSLPWIISVSYIIGQAFTIKTDIIDLSKIDLIKIRKYVLFLAFLTSLLSMTLYYNKIKIKNKNALRSISFYSVEKTNLYYI